MSGKSETQPRDLTVPAVVLALLSCLPVLVARYPQMSDYPAHLARYAIMLDGGRSADLAQWYVFRWKWTGNVGVDLLIHPFAALFGVETGARAIAGLIPPLTGLGIVHVDRALRGRTGIGSLLALPFIWSPMMLIGLLNFALGLALALHAFALWVRLEGRGWRPIAFVPIGLVVWACHMSAWGVLGIMVAGHEFARHGWRAALLRPLPLAAPLVPMLVLGGNSGAFSYGPFWWIYKEAIWKRAMRDQSQWLDIGCLCLYAALLLAALWYRRVDGRLGWSALLLLLLSWIVPRHVSGGDYVDYRMITSGLLLAALAIDWPAAPRFAALLAPAPYLVRLAVTTLAWQADSATTTRLLTALDHVPRGARVASAVLVPAGSWPLDHFEHIGAWAVLRRHALVNANFAVRDIHMLSLRHGGWSDPSQRILQLVDKPVDLASFGPARDADYLWYV
ncbi:MAG: hypothetical protein KGM17_16200, partial [Sphingomonadales bacterium]|nr:hypothetical protein [Sphingomonadales bacterium]